MKPEMQKFKKTMSNIMIQVFEKTGGTVSQMFFLCKDNSLFIKTYPNENMSSNEAKYFVEFLIKEKCKEPNAEAAAMTVEVNIRNDQGDKTDDGLMLIISAPEGIDVTIYKVDCDDKKVIGIYHEGFSPNHRDRSSSFFTNNNDYNKN